MMKLAAWTDPTGATPAPLKDLEEVFKLTVNVVLGFAGIAFFVLLLIGGIKYITSGGDPKATEGAQKTITYAIFGLVAIILSYLILVFIGEFTGVIDVTKFKIVQP